MTRHHEADIPDADKEATYLRYTRRGFTLVNVVQIVPTESNGERPNILDSVPEGLRDRHIIAIAAPDIAVAAFELNPGPHMFALLVAAEVEVAPAAESDLVAASQT